METSSVLVQNSRYVVGGQTEVNSSGTRLEWWERANFSTDDTDTRLVITKKYVGRPDLIAYDYLADSHLWWFICQYNAILDAFDEISEGRIIRIPTKLRMQTMLSGKTGGYASTRTIPTNNITAIV
jgi:hypothetical protein